MFRRLLGLVALVALLAACNDDGRTLAPAPPPPTVPPVVDEGTTSDPGLQPFLLTSPGFVTDAVLPAEYTCDGLDLLPPFTFRGVPEGTVELALAIDDVDAAGFVHLLLTGIDPTLPGITEGVLPEGAVVGTNGFGFAGYGGPCPPEGTGTHQYFFTLYALPEPSGITADTPARDATATLAGAASHIASMTAFYGE